MIKVLGLSQRQIFISLVVLNFLSFAIKFFGGTFSGSVALVTHSYDMLIDTVVSILSMWAISKQNKVQDSIALGKGILLGAFGLLSLFSIIQKITVGEVPSQESLELFGIISIVINFISLLLIFRSRNNSLLLKSSWLACRNDFVANIALILNAELIKTLNSNIPDLVVGGIISCIFIQSFIEIIVDWRQRNGLLIS